MINPPPKKISASRLMEIVLLPILAFQFILYDRSPFTLTAADKALNAVVLLLVGIYVLAAVIGADRWKKYFKPVLLGLIIILTVGVTMLGNIFSAGGVTQYLYHDGAALTDTAFENLLDGNNPYAVDYRETAFGERYGRLLINEAGETMVNPAVEQYIYFPAVFLLNGAGNGLEKAVFGFYDARMLVLLAFFGIIALLFLLMKNSQFRYSIIMLFAFNPVYFLSLFEGRNDLLLLFFILAALMAFRRRRMALAGVLFGVALAMKQFAWLFIPFLIMYFYYLPADVSPDKLKQAKKFSQSAGLTALAFILPFFIWSPGEFIRDTFLYPLGAGGADSYPISGYGFSQLTTLFGGEITGDFPFGLLAAVLAAGVLFVFWRRFKGEQSVFLVIAASAALIFFVSLVARAMNDNYISFVAQLLIFSAAFYFSEQGVIFEETNHLSLENKSASDG